MKGGSRPIVLTIAGSDSGGGAGIQADLNTFAALKVHGTTAITCLTAQNPRAVTGIQSVNPEMVRRQIEAVFAELRPASVKTGMLYSQAIIETVAAACEVSHRPFLVVDPVMVSTSGARLLKPGALNALCKKLLPLASVVTPNLDEAEILTGKRARHVEDLRELAREIFDRFGCAALVKGGHLKGEREAADVLFDGRNEWLLTAPFATGVTTHGTGCTYSAAIAAYGARGFKLATAVARAKEFITRAIHRSHRIGRHTVLDWSGADK